MNIEQAKAIPIAQILEKLGFKPTKEDEKDAWFIAPWRDEKTASLHINKEKNLWYDHGIGEGGDTVRFVQKWLQSTGADATIHDTLRWTDKMIGNVVPLKAVTTNPKQQIARKPGWILLDDEPLEELALRRYLENRGINLEYALPHLREVHIKSVKTDKRLYAIGFKNDDGGYALRNPFLKSALAPTQVTFIRGSKLNPDEIHIFEGFTDYLTYLTMVGGQQENDVLVLNSVANLFKAAGYIRKFGFYKIGHTWLDNDEAGEKTTKALTALFKLEKIKHTDHRNEYAEFKDLNEWHIEQLTLK